MFPEKKLIATEFCLKKEPEQNVTSAMGFRYAQEISGDLNHGACACVDWNILLDEKGGPYHWRERGGCAAPVIYNTQAKTICYTPIFHTIGHYSRFFNRGDHIIGSSSFSENVYCVASKDAKGSIKLVLANTSVQDRNCISELRKDCDSADPGRKHANTGDPGHVRWPVACSD